MTTINEDWDTLDDAMAGQIMITDIAILSKKEKAPKDYVVIENTHDSKKANFSEGMLGLTTRYICYTKKAASPQRGFVVVSDLKVLPTSDRPPLGYLPLIHTHDDHTKAFSSKQLLVRFEAQEQAKMGISDIVILSANKKEDVPRGYKRLPEINGFSICFKIGPVPKKNGSGKDSQTSKQPSHQTDAISRPDTAIGGKKIRSAIDGLRFELKDDGDMQKHLVQYALGDLRLLTLQDVEDKYDYDFSFSKNLTTQIQS